MVKESTPLLGLANSVSRRPQQEVGNDLHLSSSNGDIGGDGIDANDNNGIPTRRRTHHQFNPPHPPPQSSSASPVSSSFFDSTSMNQNHDRNSQYGDKKEDTSMNNNIFQKVYMPMKNILQNISSIRSSGSNKLSPRKRAEDAYNQKNLFYNDERYYEDHYNDLSWKCSFGTSDKDGIWMNTTDISGIIMASMVWIMILYSGFTVTILAQNNALPSIVAIIYCTLCALALASHAKTTFTDPGSIPQDTSSIIPTEEEDEIDYEKQRQSHSCSYPMCSVCETYKPKYTHHCRICNRCISGMDHHCPWMNNCIGKGNLKFFILFLGYLWLASIYALVLFALNYFLCHKNGNGGGGGDDDGIVMEEEKCTFPEVLIHLIRIMTVLCIGAFWFTSNMIMSVIHGIMTGLGTIDRMKREEELNKLRSGSGGRNRHNVVDIEYYANAKPIPLKDIFGIEHYYTWFIPFDPVFEDYDHVMKYSVIPRLLRERKMNDHITS